jgi:hypothetical protein
MRKSAIADPCVHLRSTTITAAATPVRETRPQTRWETTEIVRTRLRRPPRMGHEWFLPLAGVLTGVAREAREEAEVESRRDTANQATYGRRHTNL